MSNTLCSQNAALRGLLDTHLAALAAEGLIAVPISAPAAYGYSVTVNGAALDTAMRDHPAGAASLAVRPESIRLAAPGGTGLPGRVQRAAFLGQTREYEIETAAGVLFVVTPAASPAWDEGAAVACLLDRVIPLRG